MAEPLKLGIAGLGTVGASVFTLIQQQSSLLEQRCNRPVAITAVSARDKNKDRGLALQNIRWFDDPLNLAHDPETDVVIELIGGSSGTAKTLVETALNAGKDVVTANKALLAEHGTALAFLAEQNARVLAYEAAVAGGIPIIKGLREGLAANNITSVYGILNGTCNYILTEMRQTGRAFEDVLKEAQEKGYAEADPSFDVDGYDTGHKLAILSALAFGTEIVFDEKNVRGIRNVSPLDLEFANELGYRLKLLGIARKTEDGIAQSVEPCLVPQSSPIAAIDGVLNAVNLEGDFVGPTLFVGYGAGGAPTASAVVADIVDIARGTRFPMLGIPAEQLTPARATPPEKHFGGYYLRLNVVDVPGVLADITAILKDEDVSVESVLQRGRDPGQGVPLIMILHDSAAGQVFSAVKKISALDSVLERPMLMRIEKV